MSECPNVRMQGLHRFDSFRFIERKSTKSLRNIFDVNFFVFLMEKSSMSDLTFFRPIEKDEEDEKDEKDENAMNRN